MADQHALSWPPSASSLGVDPGSAQAEDLALIASCLAGEESAFTRLYNQHAAAIYRLAFSLLRNQEDAEEVLQDSFEYAFRKLRRYDPRKSAFKSWLYQIAISRCRNKRRRKRHLQVSLSTAEFEVDAKAETGTPVEALERSIEQRAVWDAVGELSPKLREAAVLRFFEGYSYREIGRILGVPAKTAQSRMRLAQEALKAALADVQMK